jgi:hypothetical protein
MIPTPARTSGARTYGLVLVILFLLMPVCGLAQTSSEVKEILDRLSKLEEENRTLVNEVHALREQLVASHTLPEAGTSGAAPATPAAETPVSERIDVVEHRVAELQQTKVEASQRFPVRLTGTFLFNAFLNGRYSGGQQDPTVAQTTPGVSGTGASFRQSVIGLQYDGPTWAGAKFGGTAYVDFFAGSSSSLNHLVRLRIATMDMEWENTTLTFGQDKPIISPREPNSLAQVGFSPLTGAGNLWLWEPQARIEQRFSFGESAGLKAQLGIFETAETSTAVPLQYASSQAPGRPGYEGRFNFWRDFGSGRRIEIAPGFHFSSSHVAGTSVPSDIFSVDWLVVPASKLRFSGMFFDGKNVAGLGSLRQGYSFFGDTIAPIHAAGGWAQISIPFTPRLTFNAYSGEEADRARDLQSGAIRRNLVTAGNLFYRFGPNVLGSFEISQTRTAYIWIGNRLNNHYDLALAYLF